jgi:preprotein translocase subunit YajC
MDQYTTLILIALMVVAFYFLIMRPQRKRQQEIQRILTALTPGQRVMLGSGLFGTVVSVGEKQVVLETSPGSELTVLKQAVARVVTDADEDGAVDETDLDTDAVTAEPEGPLPVEPEPIRPVGNDPEPPATGAGQRPTTAG